jgi:hypothetical protein
VFALWTAKRSEISPGCNIQRLVVPRQTPETSIYGVSVLIEGDELARIAYANHAVSEKNVIQLHTHPARDVSMSELDREREVVRHVGGLSIIVPRYGLHGLDRFRGVNVYEREKDDWRLWAHDETVRRLRIV